MTNIEAYKIWAPQNVLWTLWAKPVLFACMTTSAILEDESISVDLPEIRWKDFLLQDTAIIVDLPGLKGVEEGLALAQIGYRPVPLYNGVYSNTFMTVSTGDLARSLYKGAKVLADIYIRDNAPPVFLLDSMRKGTGSKIPGMYDNRWCVFAQDMPSASFLKKQGIKKIIVRTEGEKSIFASKISDDLAHILCRYQEEGIKIQHTFGVEPENIIVSKPSHFKKLFYRYKVIFGLTQNPAGGFGGMTMEFDDSGRAGSYG